MDPTMVGTAGIIISSFPVVLAWFFCSIFAFSQWKKRPTAAIAVLFVCVLFFVDLIGGFIYSIGIVPKFYTDFGWDYETAATLQTAMGFCRSVLHGFLFCVIVWGAFSKSAVTKETETSEPGN